MYTCSSPVYASAPCYITNRFSFLHLVLSMSLFYAWALLVLEVILL
jgi:hypothetical protein